MSLTASNPYMPKEMRECKKCFTVKPIKAFFIMNKVSYPFIGTFVSYSWLCDKCADKNAQQANIKLAESLEPKNK